jgi:uncharacterized protein (UPF0210 family)
MHLTHRLRLRQLTLLLFWLVSSAAVAATPQVRAVTAFVDLDPARFEQQIAETASKLQHARARFEQAGFAVQTLRITTQQALWQSLREMGKDRALALLLRLDELATKGDLIINLGPPALDDHPDPLLLELLGEVQARSTRLQANMIVASDAGVHWITVRAAARHILRVAQRSPHSQGTFAFAAVAMPAVGTPYSPGSYHVNEAGRFSIGLQSANVVAEVFARSGGNATLATRELTAALAAHARDVHRIAAAIEQRTGLKYWGLDPTPVPLKDESIGAAMEAFHGTTFGSPGTLTAAYVVTEALKELPGPRVGYSGLMLPVMEDTRLAQRWNEGAISLDALLAYSAVCATGLDTVPLPGDVTEAQLTRIIGDVAVLAFKWKKPLNARLQPVHGRVAGEMSDFDNPYLTNVRLQPVR